MRHSAVCPAVPSVTLPAAQEREEEAPQSEGFTFLRPGQRVVRRLVSGPRPPETAVRPAPPPLPHSPRAAKVSPAPSRLAGQVLSRGRFQYPSPSSFEYLVSCLLSELSHRLGVSSTTLDAFMFFVQTMLRCSTLFRFLTVL